MAKVEIVTQPWAGSAHVEPEEGNILFATMVFVNGFLVTTESPKWLAWRARVEEGYPMDTFTEDTPGVSLNLGDGEGFMVLVIRHADDITWRLLQGLDDGERAEGSTREEFGVLVKELTHVVERPRRRLSVA